MSLTRPKKDKKNRRGRISYVQLGINQLGAVYEALLSYQGFFAETELYEVKKAKDKHNVLETAYFVKSEDIDVNAPCFPQIRRQKRGVKFDSLATLVPDLGNLYPDQPNTCLNLPFW